MSRSSAFVVLLALLAACAEPSEPAGDPTGVVWELQSGSVDDGPVPIIEGHPITLSLNEDGAGGTSACNSYSGEYVAADDRIGFSELIQTDKGCMPAEVMEWERVYLVGLSRVDRFSMDEGDLRLSGEGVELVFVALPPVPDAGLTSTVWVLDSLVQATRCPASVGIEPPWRCSATDRCWARPVAAPYSATTSSLEPRSRSPGWRQTALAHPS